MRLFRQPGTVVFRIETEGLGAGKKFLVWAALTSSALHPKIKMQRLKNHQNDSCKFKEE